MTGVLVVVLGSVGRNFAAGMSGGLAYVYDEDGAFEAHCNKEMVELVPMDAEGAATVKDLLREHVQRTGSPKAAAILANWGGVAGRFVKVFPSEYRRALEAAASPATNGLAISELSPGDPDPVLVAGGEVK
jgi:glutamate synthase (NADPH/NADH) large chain